MQVFAIIAMLVAACLATVAARAQDVWPSRQVNLLVPYPAGGYIDAVTRLVAEGMREKFGQPFVVLNRVGGNGQVALGELSRAAPDGYTLLTNNEGGISVPPALDRNFKFDPAKDFTALAQVVAADYVLIIRSSLPARNVAEFVALAKSSTKPVSYASPGTGSTPHIAMEFFARQVGAEFLHVPYAGAAPAMNDLASGQIDSYMPSVPTMIGQATNEKLRILAALGKTRASHFPDVPTMEESGHPGLVLDGWLGLFGPPNMSESLRTRISAALAEVVREPRLSDKLRSIGSAPVTRDAATFAPFYLSEVARWKKFSETTNIKVGD